MGKMIRARRGETTTLKPPPKSVGKERLLRKTSLGAQYVQTQYTGSNESGIDPVGDSVLIICDKPVEKSAGGIILTETTRSEHEIAAETGVLVAVGVGAWVWNADRTRPFEGKRPKPGDRVYFTRYSGQLTIGRDGLEYRLMTDNCIGGVEID
jgi:chaperonin GroES